MIVAKIRKGVVWWATDYMSRHQNNWSRALHIVGVPLAPFGVVVLLAMQRWLWALGAFVVGYALQWLGHHIEGNEVGEWILLKYVGRRLVGRRAHESVGDGAGDGGDGVPGSAPGGEPGAVGHPSPGPGS